MPVARPTASTVTLTGRCIAALPLRSWQHHAIWPPAADVHRALPSTAQESIERGIIRQLPPQPHLDAIDRREVLLALEGACPEQSIVRGERDRRARWHFELSPDDSFDLVDGRSICNPTTPRSWESSGRDRRLPSVGDCWSARVKDSAAARESRTW